jgi:hypothetical protein
MVANMVIKGFADVIIPPYEPFPLVRREVGKLQLKKKKDTEDITGFLIHECDTISEGPGL